MIQEFDSKVLYLIKQKKVHPYEYMSGFERCKEELSSKRKFSSSLMGKTFNDKGWVLACF